MPRFLRPSQNKKTYFLIILSLLIGISSTFYISKTTAAVASITYNSGTVTLQNDADANTIVNIGDTVRVTANITNTDGDGVDPNETTVTADLSAFGCGAAVAMDATDGLEGNTAEAWGPVDCVVVAGATDVGISTQTVDITYSDADDGAATSATSVLAEAFDNTAPTIGTPGTVALTNDVGSDGVASIGDTITYAAGTPGSADGDSWTVDLSAYGLSATAAPGAFVIVADNDDAAFAANETLTDNGGNTVAGAATITGAFNIDNIAPTIGTPGTVALTNDVGGDSVASIGDTITYAAGTPGSADGDSWTVDLSAYGLSATAAPGAYVIIADNDDAAFAANETLTDNGGNTVAGAATITGAFNIDNIAPTIGTPGTVALTNDVGGDSVASIGDTITYAAGTPGSADGDSWTVDLSAYGLSATAAPGAYVIIADNDDAAFAANETLTDNGGNTVAGAATITGAFNIDNVAPTLASWNIDLTANTLTLTLSETADASSLNVTAITIQNAATATTSYTLTNSTTASVDGTTIVINLSTTDGNAIKANTGLATSQANSYLILTSASIDDMAANGVTAIADGAGVNATAYTAAPVVVTGGGGGGSSFVAKADSTTGTAKMKEWGGTVSKSISDSSTVSVEFPEKTFKEEVTVSIIPKTISDYPELPEGFELVENLLAAVDISYRYGGDSMENLGTVSFQYAPTEESSFSLLSLYHFNETSQAWEYISATREEETADQVTVELETKTFSVFALVGKRTGIVEDNFHSSAGIFSDVSPSHENEIAIRWMKENGIVEGYSDGTYKPEQKVNRAEFVKILVETVASQEEIDQCTQTAFSDVPSRVWYAPYVCVAQQKDIIGGYPDGTFRAEQNITFPEAAKVMANTLELELPDTNGEWYESYIEALGNVNAIPRSINNLLHEVNRGEMAEQVWRIKTNVSNLPSRSSQEF